MSKSDDDVPPTQKTKKRLPESDVGDALKSADQPSLDENIPPPRKTKRRSPESDVGDALKSAYQRTLDENIPPEMLDLLGKLD